MTPEWARTIYHAALGRAYIKYVLNWDKPLIQHEAELIAWKAVMNDPDTDEAKAALQAYLDAKGRLDTHPETVQRLWTTYCDLC